MKEHGSISTHVTGTNAGLPNTLVDILPVAIYTCDNFGYITVYNQAAVELWGRNPEIGQDLWCGSWRMFRLTGEPLSLDDCPMAQTLKTGRPINGEEIIIERPDGSRVFVKAYPKPLYDGEGKLIGAVNTLVNISGQKKDETEKMIFASIIESAEVPIISKTTNGIITSWNKAAERLFGYKASEVTGKSITILIPHDRLEEEVVILGKINRVERVEHYETIRLTKGQKEVAVSLTISPINDQNGQVIGASKIVIDITKQKIYEEKLQRYTENVEILNTIGKLVSESLDIEEILQKVTDASTQIVGAAFGAFFYNKLDANGESYTLFTLSGAPREAFEKFGMPRNTKVFDPTFKGEGTIRCDDITKDPRYGHNHPHYGMPKGHLPVVSYLAVPVRSKSEEVIGGLFYGHPLPAKFTEEHESLIEGIAAQAGIALDNAKLYAEVQKLNIKKDEFIGLASHELKTPVTSLKGYLQILNTKLAVDDSNKQFVNKAVQQIGKLSNLISDLLDVSKIETGQLPLNLSSFDLVQVVKETVGILQYSTKSHHLIINTDVQYQQVEADLQRIEQVIINLVSNAIKYSPRADQVIVSISTNLDHATVSVQDFGMGISNEQQERIFTRFYRVEEMAAHISGLGIGLYISREIINRHQGKLYLKSQPGNGSVFTFDLPLSPPG